MSRYDEIYSKLVRRYRERHSDMSGFADRMNKLTSEGKAWEEAVLHFALELGIEVPEIKQLIESGKSPDEATRTVSDSLTTERRISDFRSSLYRFTNTSLLPCGI